ncbi:MAG: hypothetical protein HZB12_00510 [Candidatus Yonathbacteria bacterium]|nr:hypothetical protein [Candidatus Yonathbacteria bacterium]
MTDWNLGNKGNLNGDLLTDVLNVQHGYVVPGSAYHAVHSNNDEIDMLEADDKNQFHWDGSYADPNYDHVDSELSSGVETEDTGNQVVTCEEEQLAVAVGINNDYEELSTDLQVNAIDLERWHPFFRHCHHRGVPKNTKHARSEVLAVSHGRGVKSKVLRRKHHQFHEHIRVQ